MSNYIYQKLNGCEKMTRWRDGDGCNERTTGNYSTRLQDIKKTNYLLFILSRLIRVGDQLQIVDRKVEIGGNVWLSDVSGHSASFSPIAVIHHTGQVTENTTSGHYQADVLDSSSGKWIRTSDDAFPVEISETNISDQGYIFLYKKNQ